jgi:peptide/nickel transport system substrate-binding protein
MRWRIQASKILAVLALVLMTANAAFAQKARRDPLGLPPRQPGEHVYSRGGEVGVIMPMMGVFNNLVIFDQHVPQNRMQSIVPEPATSWARSEDGTELTFKLRDRVKWHDGKRFTSEDVKCTFDLLTNQGKEKLRLNYRETWWVNVAKTTTNGQHEASLHLKRPQPALLALLASGDTPIYPAMSRRATCASIRSAPAPSNSSNTSRTSISGSPEIPIIGNRAGRISTGSSTRSFRTARRRSSPSLPASST